MTTKNNYKETLTDGMGHIDFTNAINKVCNYMFKCLCLTDRQAITLVCFLADTLEDKIKEDDEKGTNQ